MSLPRVHITEQLMREGMQIESVQISLADKAKLLDALSECGFSEIMVGSFVSPRYTPQMAEMDTLMGMFTPKPGVRYTALALNEMGRQRRSAYVPPLTTEDRLPRLSCHMCDTFVRRNANISQQQEIDSWPASVAKAKAAGVTEAAIGVNATFGSNFTGYVPIEERFTLLRRQHQMWSDAGIRVVGAAMGDPMGWVAPHWLGEHLSALLTEWPDLTQFYLHLHDSRGLALASHYEAIRLLDDRHDIYTDTTAGGIGGCPYCGNGRATGMAATEDLVNLLDQLGIDTDIDVDAVIRVVWMLEDIIGRPAFGKVSKAGPHPSDDELYDPNLPLIETMEDARHFLCGPGVVEQPHYPWRTPIPPAIVRGGRPTTP
jgi:hydroxymethylglutaryl-CoA lyase